MMASKNAGTARRPGIPGFRAHGAQFSLRLLLVAVAVLSIGFAAAARHLAFVRREREAISALRKTGVVITNASSGSWLSEESEMHAFLRRILGDIIAPHLDLSFTNALTIDDRLLAQIASIRSLKVLSFCGGSFALRQRRLSELTTLETLHLDHVCLRERDLADISALTRLDWLSLDNTPLGDASLRLFKRLRGLKCLSISRSDVTADAIRDVAVQLPALTHLYVVDVPITDSEWVDLCERLPHCGVYRE